MRFFSILLLGVIIFPAVSWADSSVSFFSTSEKTLKAVKARREAAEKSDRKAGPAVGPEKTSPPSSPSMGGQLSQFLEMLIHWVENWTKKSDKEGALGELKKNASSELLEKMNNIDTYFQHVKSQQKEVDKVIDSARQSAA